MPASERTPVLAQTGPPRAPVRCLPLSGWPRVPRTLRPCHRLGLTRRSRNARSRRPGIVSQEGREAREGAGMQQYRVRMRGGRGGAPICAGSGVPKSRVGRSGSSWRMESALVSPSIVK
ncbi:hypothetical protein NN561_010785 [Cricetulus griseus]